MEIVVSFVTANMFSNIASADRASYFSSTALQYVLLFGAMAVTLIASGYVRSVSGKYSKVRISSGMTGGDAAAMILRSNGLASVSITPVRGSLTDNYNPKTRAVSLSDDVYGRSTVTAVAVAAHECGHALQDAEGYAFLRMRTSIAPVVGGASTVSWILILIGLIFAVTPFTRIGVILFMAVVVFQIITLPVEFNASGRALAILNNSGTLTAEEMKGARKVLTAAAMTYVAALASSVMTLVRLILLTNRRN